jgi:hypothetical protein
MRSIVTTHLYASRKETAASLYILFHFENDQIEDHAHSL